MTKIKLCGMSEEEHIRTANSLRPDYIGFVFAPSSRRYVSYEKAAGLRAMLDPGILAAGVFVDEDPAAVERLLLEGVIDLAQLHGHESEEYIRRIKENTGRPVIRAFRVRSEEEIRRAETCGADLILLDSGAGTGETFDWMLAGQIHRPYFLAGGLNPENIGQAVRSLRPFGVDVSSGIETDGRKDRRKMKAFTEAVRKADEI